jgi:hypothetical protein
MKTDEQLRVEAILRSRYGVPISIEEHAAFQRAVIGAFTGGVSTAQRKDGVYLDPNAGKMFHLWLLAVEWALSECAKGRDPRAAAPEQAAEAAAPSDHDEAILLLSAVFDAWENGDPCHEDGDPSGTYLGTAFRLDDDVFNRCCALLNRTNPPRNVAPAAAPVRGNVPDLTNVIHWLEGGCDPKWAAVELRTYQRQIGQDEAPALASAVPPAAPESQMRDQALEEASKRFDEAKSKMEVARKRGDHESADMWKGHALDAAIDMERALTPSTNGEQQRSDAGWVRVSERLPKERGRYMVYQASFLEPIRIVNFGTSRGWENGRDKIHPREKRITHWMPLPQPPASNGNGEKGGAA